MTPTEQDEKLREKISKTCEGIATGYHGEDGIDYIMQLITADRKRVALEARIEEWEKFLEYENSANGRMATLKSQLSKSKEEK